MDSDDGNNEEIKNENEILDKGSRKRKYMPIHPIKTPGEKKQDKLQRKKRQARLIVRNISFKATEDKLNEYFSQFGTIEDINLLKRPDGKLMGCAFIQFSKINEAAQVKIKCNGKKIFGREIHIDFAIDKSTFNKKFQKRKLNVETATPDYDFDIVPIKEETDSNIPDDVSIRDEIKSDISSDEMMNDENYPEHDSNDDEDEEDDDVEDAVDDVDNKSDIKLHNKRIKLESNSLHKTNVTNDVSEGCTVFIKNIPFEATNDDLRKSCEQFGRVLYAVINIDKVSGHTKDTGFVKFKLRESADMCLNAGTEFKLFNNILDSLPALSHNDIKTKINKRESLDSRNLYLAKEGLITAGLPAAEGVSPSDMAKRLQLEKNKGQILKNLNRFISKERLTIHNIPFHYDNNKLREIVQNVTKLKPRECRVMRENKPSMGQPLGKSKGFAFISFKKHADALACLRTMNNNPSIFGKNNRPIVSFSIEDKTVHNIKQLRLQRSREKNPLFKQKLSKKIDKSTSSFSSSTTNLKQPNKNITTKKSMDNGNEVKLAKFSGITSEPGIGLTMRPNWKLKEQQQIHANMVGAAKKNVKKQKAKKLLKIEKKQIDRTKQRKKIKDVDNFAFMVDRIKKIFDKDSESRDKKPKRSKWYVN